MKYSDIDSNNNFAHNMRDTPWTKLFPHWWSDDALMNAIGAEVERIKARMIFGLLNLGLKPPVMIWQSSIDHKEYIVNHNITQFPDSIEIDTLMYKTWGKIILTNNADYDIYDLNIMFNNQDGITINNTIAPNDKVTLDLTTQTFSINNHQIEVSKHGEGLSHFIISQYAVETEENSQTIPIHNEHLKITFNADNQPDVDLDVEVVLNNAVFINEQNIEITSLELIPIDRVDLYAYYDFPFRNEYSGWTLAFTKEYDKKTNVIYDMITTQLHTKEFYVEVYFRELEYPYKVGFPCYQDAEEDSMYHVNNRLDTWGKLLGLQRREYKTDIPEEDYPFTFPIFYPFDIEQDFWYYSRLINEYCWNDEAINDVDLLDTNGHSIMRLHSIDPFVQDFAIHAKTIQPTERENINYNFYIPQTVNAESRDIIIDENYESDSPYLDVHPHNKIEYSQANFIDIENLLDYNDNYSMITLYNKTGKYITYDLYKSKELDLFFNLSNLPPNINIEGFEFTIDAEATDNGLDKYNDDRTRVELRSFGETIFAKSIGESGQYGLERDEIIYGGKNILFDFDEKIINKKIGDAHVSQKFIVQPFSGTLTEYVEIPFTFIENDEKINELNNINVIYDNTTTVTGDYITETRDNEKVNVIRAYIPDGLEMNTITIQSLKSNTHYPFTVTFNIHKLSEKDSDDHDVQIIEGPIINNQLDTFTYTDEWNTGDLRDILQKSGLHFIYTLQNDNETTTPTFIIYNITLKVYYSPKKTNFDLQTYIDMNTHNELIAGYLNIDITNTGSIPFVSQIDIFNEQNISLSTNSINVDLNPQDKAQYKVEIQQQPPLVNGTYDIITLCEDVKRQNSIIIDTGGLIQTTTKVKPIFTQYHQQTLFEAYVNTTNKNNINSGLVEFYIDKHLINTVAINDGYASVEQYIDDLDIETGFHTFEARYIGSDKYAPSRASSMMLISKQKADINITSEKFGNLTQPFICEAVVTSNGQKVTEGNVTFYLDDEELGRVEVDNNGNASLTHIFNDKKPCSYVLKAVYNGTATYGRTETTQNIILSGGETEIVVYNITGAPTERITLSAKVIQKMCAKAQYNNVPHGKITVKIVDNETVLFTTTKTVNNEGRISASWTIPSNITIKDYQILCQYHDNENIFYDSENTGILSVQRKNVQLKHQALFYGSRYEPLGFFIQVKDENNIIVTEGQISINIPSLNITITSDIDDDGNAKLIYNAIDFTYEEWNELEHLTFKRGEGNTFYYDGVLEKEMPENLYRIYDNDYHDLQYVDFEIRNGDLYYIRESESDEQVYIGDDGFLYARTNIDDINLSQKQYVIGTHDMTINYIPTKKYNSVSNNAKIKINDSQIDADLHSYHLKYNSNESLVCYITEYDWKKNKNALIHDSGSAYFYVDNIFLGKVRVLNGKAILPQEVLNDITANKHLLFVEYIPDNKALNHTFTYTLLSIEQIPSTINYQKNRMLQDKDTHFTFTIELPPEYEDMATSGYIYGNVDILLNNEVLHKHYLFGNEDGVLEDIIHIPNDININDYELTVNYEGTSFIAPSQLTIPLQHTVLPVSINDVSLQTTANEICDLNIHISAADNDDISEGRIVIYYDDEVITKANVLHNNAHISFNVGNVATGHYQYIIKYEEGINYTNGANNALLHVNIINPLDKIYVSEYGNDNSGNGSKTKPFKTLTQAINCIKDNGEIYILDTAFINQSININKNIYINGDNNSTIAKDLNDLFNDNTINYNNLHVYNTSSLDKTLHEIQDLQIHNLNTNEFTIINKELYFLKNEELIPVYLYDNNKFYSSIPLSISDINKVYTITSNKTLHINNIIFESNDNDVINDFTLINNGTLIITHSIIKENIYIKNNKILEMHRNNIYGEISAGIEYDLDNNWWGQNTSPYTTNNNIILKIYANIEPPVLGEDFHVILEMIGENGKTYDIPQLNFSMTADTGHIQTPLGNFHNQKHDTLYVDAVKEGKIYASVDDETVSMPVYSYDRKTEIIFDEASTIPIGYQIPIRAKIQSCADIFYQFDKNNNIIKQSNDINDGEVIFYLNNEQIGRANVYDGMAEILIFFSENKYEINQTYNISATYHNSKYYFDSTNNKDISLTSENNICFVDPNGNNNNDGTFNKPLQSITAALLLKKDIIYLKDGFYSDENIIINDSVIIKKYNNYAIFANNKNDYTTIFNITDNNNINVTLEGLDFINNECNVIINNMNNLTIEKCIFYNNHVKNTIIDNIYSKQLNIYRSVIVDNNKFINNVSKITKLQYCWFGTNTPNEDECIPHYQINDYIIMDVITSKDVIYLGTIARITSRLKHYQHDDEQYIFEETLPLRIATFMSNGGSLLPLKDYTYYNQATSLFNSNESSNADKIILSLPDNTNYLNETLTLKCNVNDAIGNNIEEGIVNFSIIDGSRIYTHGAVIQNGIATLQLPYVKLGLGEYNINCNYYNDNVNYSISGVFSIKQPSIILNHIEMHNITLESMQIYVDNIRDSLNKKVYNQAIHIFLDNHKVTNAHGQDIFYIKNGIINDIIYYDLTNAGTHQLSITTKDIASEYDILSYTQSCNIDKYDTHIDFKYKNIQKDYVFDLTFNILDSHNNFVRSGSVDVYFNDTLIADDISVYNGICIVPNFVINEKGMHTFYINYHGDNKHYNECSYSTNNIIVDLFEVVIDSEELQQQLVTNSHTKLDLHFTIKDVLDNKINKGYVNIYIDDILVGDNIYLLNHYIDTSLSLPYDIAIGRHDFTVEYIDDTNTYANTTLDTFMYITQIPVNIIIDNIKTTPLTKISIPYDIQSPYGTVNTGTLTAWLNDEQIGSVTVGNISNQVININIPKVNIHEDTYIHFVYTDGMGNYQETSEDIYVQMQPKHVNITPSHTWYYPNKEFILTVTVKDDNGNYINDGDVTIYIDNVKESDTKDVTYGESEFALSFNQVKDYELNIAYNDNEYYQSTTSKHNFKVSALPINNITFEEELSSVANTTYSNTLIFDTFENQMVYDGIVDIFLNNDKLGTYYITNLNKEFKVEIGDLSAGEYNLTISYHDSELFDTYQQDYIFTIQERTLNMTINNGQNITAHLSEKIDIPVQTDVSTKGLIKYYIGVNESQMKFIGVTQLDGTTSTYHYTLPQVLDEKPDNQKYYIIKAVFENNGKYQEAIAYANLEIKLTTPTLHIDPLTAYYHSNIEVIVINNITNTAPLDFYINDEYIGSGTSDNEKCIFKYTLPTKYLAGEYDLTVVYNKTSIMNENQFTTTLTIEPSPVVIDIPNKQIYVGHDIVLDTYGVDTEGRSISEGSMSFTINDIDIMYENNTIFDMNEKIHYQLPQDINQDTQIVVQYQSHNTDKYQDTISYIPLTILKHHIDIDIIDIKKYTHGDTTNMHLRLTSPTNNNINVPVQFKMSTDKYEINDTVFYNNAEVAIQIDISPLFGNYSAYDLLVNINETDIFKESQKHFDIPIYNKSTIYVDSNQDNDVHIGTIDDPVNTINKAIDLVNNNGTIKILSDNVFDDKIIIDKNINIISDEQVQCHAQFDIQAKLSLQNFIFNNYDDVIFNNNGELIITDCLFSNNQSRCIINNNVLDISNTIFNNNQSDLAGTCIAIEKNNQHTSITNCIFNENSTSYNGSCIDSYKGNDVLIQGNYFGPNHTSNGDGTYISTYGNMNIIDNIFYPCAKSAIYVLSGNIQIELNIFHNDIQKVIYNIDGTVSANMNYWGTNQLDDIEDKYNGYVNIDTWLLANYELNASTLDESDYIIGHINQYANRLETEIYEFIFNNFIHHNVDTVLYYDNQQTNQSYIDEKINLSHHDNIKINIFGNNIEVVE